MSLELMLESIRIRKAVSPFGISVASAYVGAMAPCLSGEGGGLCPVKLFGLASSDLWAKEIAEAANRLTYCDESMADPDFLSKSIREGTDIIKGAVLEYDCILSSRRKDRDGDVVEQKGGLTVDPKMPALWQHIQVQPIGKHIAVLSQDEQVTKSRFALADTELGRDAATLVKFGALRKSIGFRPSEFEPIELVKGADGKEYARGWHVKQSNVMEGSLVSIPANPDANILSHYEKEFDGLATAHSRGLLKHAMIQLWAKGVYQARPLQVPGVTLQTKNGESTITKGGAAQANGHAETNTKDCPKCGKSKLDSTGSCPQCGHVEVSQSGETPKAAAATLATKAAAGLSTKELSLTVKAYGENPHIEGSWEYVQHALDRQAHAYLVGQGITPDSYSGWTHTVATFPASIVICLRRDGKSSCYQIDWSMNAEGEPKLSGEPKAVDVKTSIVEKAMEAFTTKAARFSPLPLPPAKKTVQQLTAELLSIAIESPDSAGLQKAFDDIAGHAQILRQQREDRELRELLNI